MMKEPMKRFAVITGTRRSSPRLLELVSTWLRSLHPDTVLIEGDAKGADRIAGNLWRKRGRCVHEEPADWDAFGDRAAGPVRNAAMVAMAVELRARGWVCESCVAFPDSESRGTWGCVRKLRIVGFDVDVTEV